MSIQLYLAVVNFVFLMTNDIVQLHILIDNLNNFYEVYAHVIFILLLMFKSIFRIYFKVFSSEGGLIWFDFG